jgi:hypothetical protein
MFLRLQAVKTAVGAIAPIEPFNLWYYINDQVNKAKPQLEKLKLERMEQVSVPGRSNQGVGMAQIGFACFWPNGGGPLPVTESTAAIMDGDNSQVQPKLATLEDLATSTIN